MGHVTRSLALAQAWIDDGADVRWLARELPAPIRQHLAAEGIPVTLMGNVDREADDARETCRIAGEIVADWVVLDGYRFDVLHQTELKGAGRRVLFVDDTGEAEAYTADVVLNQNAYADREMYARKDRGALYLTGPRYAMLRREFRQTVPRPRRSAGEPMKVLVLFGGAGHAGLANTTIAAFSRLASRRCFDVRLIAGFSVAIDELDRRDAGGWLTIVPYIEDIGAAAAWADLAVSAAGSTMYELMYNGVPTLMVSVANNQRRVARAIEDLGAGIDLGAFTRLDAATLADAIDRLASDATTRAHMSATGQLAVDGQGSLRVRSVMIAGLLHLRPARWDDARCLWEWANNPETRAVSFSSAPIPWPHHERWFAAHLDDASHVMFIGQARGGIPVGCVRFELAGPTAVISVNVAPAFRGSGFGRWLIRLGALEVLRMPRVTEVHAYVKPDNVASVRAFEGAGFLLHSRSEVHGQPALLLALTNPASAGAA